VREDIVPFLGTGTLQIVGLLQRPTPDSSQRQKTVPAKESCETPIFNENEKKKKNRKKKERRIRTARIPRAIPSRVTWLGTAMAS
jgi:hypothetical protein